MATKEVRRASLGGGTWRMERDAGKAEQIPGGSIHLSSCCRSHGPLGTQVRLHLPTSPIHAGDTRKKIDDILLGRMLIPEK